MTLAILATETLSVKRPPAVTNGKRGAPSAVAGLASLSCTPLYPVDTAKAQELAQRLKLPTTIVLLETFVVGRRDVRHGDVVTVGGADYPVRAVAPWRPFTAAGEHTHVIVEDVQP